VTLLSNPVAAMAFRTSWDYTRRYHSFFVGRMYGDPSKVTEQTLNGYAANLAQKGTAEYGLAVVRAWKRGMKELRELYPKFHAMPTLIVWGDCDCAVAPESAHELHRALPGSQLVMLPGIGHLPYEECPEKFNRILLEFLARPVF
jgi:4,5:9,10-diseco-3-hydroxy-5,9,17-trioxoandrosta-1(10),2-diene-4-oate hydrolase